MEETILPTWYTASPSRIGDGNHGKVSADGWCTFCSVHLIVTLGHLWCNLPSEDHKYKLFANFCTLMHATKIATMRSVTIASAQEFEDTIFTYLGGIRKLFPSYEFLPSHHVALHMKELLCCFGQTHAWHCWVFERYNHVLQQIPTNGNFGMLHHKLVIVCTVLTVNYRPAQNNSFSAPVYEPETKGDHLFTLS